MLIVHSNEEVRDERVFLVLDRTFREIAEVVKTGPVIIYAVETNGQYDYEPITNKVTAVGYNDGNSNYFVECDSMAYPEFETTDLDDYPKTETENK